MLGWLRLDIVKLLLLALPAVVVKQLLVDLQVPIGGRSWSAAVLVLPLLVVVWWIWRVRQPDRPVALGHGYLMFFMVYCLLFAVAADSDVLTGPRRLISGYEEVVPRNFLALNSWGDWHYWWTPEAPPAKDMIVVTFPSFAGQYREDVRRGFAFLIRKALENEARGVAFDYYLKEPSGADRLLESLLDQAAAKGMPVLFGYQHLERDGLVIRQPPTASLAEALPLERQGHLGGYLEYDDRVRLLPVDLPGTPGLRSLSFKIASALRAGSESTKPLRVPSTGLLQFTMPADGIRLETFSPNLDWELWRDRFIIVGTADQSDQRQTPFGPLQGAVIHAYAANSLRHEHFIHRLDPRWTFPAIFLLCYILTLTAARGAAWRVLLLTACGLSLAVCALAALALRYALVWIDLSYPLSAIWLLIALQSASRLSSGAWRRRSRESTLELPGAPAGDDERLSLDLAEAGFDVFLSHNGKDKTQVRRIGESLKARGLRPWLDEWELVPGRPWQEALEEIIRTVGSSAVLVGKDGLGPWEVPEMRASLSECVRRGLPVIPVLLPGAGTQPMLPLFLTQYTWVDLRAGLSAEGLDRLEWGVTGRKPRRAEEEAEAPRA